MKFFGEWAGVQKYGSTGGERSAHVSCLTLAVDTYFRLVSMSAVLCVNPVSRLR